jgi:hypothetical protein
VAEDSQQGPVLVVKPIYLCSDLDVDLIMKLNLIPQRRLELGQIRIGLK